MAVEPNESLGCLSQSTSMASHSWRILPRPSQIRPPHPHIRNPLTYAFPRLPLPSIVHPLSVAVLPSCAAPKGCGMLGRGTRVSPPHHAITGWYLDYR